MNTSEEHKELSEIEATANQGLPISGRQHSKELWKEETSSSLSLPIRYILTLQTT